MRTGARPIRRTASKLRRSGSTGPTSTPLTPPDPVLFRNAGVPEESVVEADLRAGGWVLANDYLTSASHQFEVDRLELVGVVPDD